MECKRDGRPVALSSRVYGKIIPCCHWLVIHTTGGFFAIRHLFSIFLVSFLIGSVIPVGAVVEKEIPELSDSTLMPYFLEHFTPGVIKNRDGAEICYAKSEAAGQAGALVVVDGRTEFMAKYSEVFYDLRDTGLSFYIYDHRGQGESSRLLPDRQKGHVEHFDDYIEDLHLFLDTVVKTGSHGPIFLLSHSMGATISVLHERKYPGTVTGMILCSPMFSVNTAPFPPLLARGLSRVFTFLGFGTRYVIGGKPYDHHQMFEKNDLTDSFARFELNRRRVEENPRVALGSPTFSWLAEAFSAMDRIRNRYHNSADPHASSCRRGGCRGRPDRCRRNSAMPSRTVHLFSCRVANMSC